MENPSALTVKVLRARLEEHGLETFGLKAQLVARLEAFLAEAAASSLESTAVEGECEDEAEVPAATTTTTEASVESGEPEKEEGHNEDEPVQKRQKTEDAPEKTPAPPMVAEEAPKVEPDKSEAAEPEEPTSVEPEKPKAAEPEKPAGPAYVRLRGLPWSTTRANVVDFFRIEGITEENVSVVAGYH